MQGSCRVLHHSAHLRPSLLFCSLSKAIWAARYLAPSDIHHTSSLAIVPLKQIGHASFLRCPLRLIHSSHDNGLVTEAYPKAQSIV